MKRWCLLVIISLFLSSAQPLKKQEVKDIFEEMLALHIEHKNLSTALMQKSSKFYLEQFDAAKMYLLDSEVDHLCSLSQNKLDQGVANYQVGDLSFFEALNQVIAYSIIRARQWRLEIEKEWILSAHELQPSKSEVYLTYAKNQDQLKARMQRHLANVLLEEKRLNQLEKWTPSDREKIFYLWETKFRRKEDTYLPEMANQEHQLSVHSLKALARSLDAHTSYYSPEEALDMRRDLEKQFEGIGIVVKEGIQGVVIVDLVKGGPAAESGQIQPGDRLLKIDGSDTSSMSYDTVLEALKGDGKKELTLTIIRHQDQSERRVTLTKASITLHEDRVQSKFYPCAGGIIGVLTLPSFYEAGKGSTAEKDLRAAITKLKSQGRLKGLILDMRENAGGFVSQAVKVASLFMNKGIVVISKYAHGRTQYLRNLESSVCYDGPLILLTSRASASATEIVAQALQDYGTALVVGDEETYGKGTIQYQTITDKEAKAFYKVTVGRYYTVSGRSTQIRGVKADIVVPTCFANYKIGERYLENPLPGDDIHAAYVDPLTDIDYRNRLWFQKNYLPNLQQPQTKWQAMLPKLRENSQYRLQSDPNFLAFTKEQAQKTGRSPRAFKRVENPSWGKEDLQVKEAYHILQDMLVLANNPPTS